MNVLAILEASQRRLAAMQLSKMLSACTLATIKQTKQALLYRCAVALTDMTENFVVALEKKCRVALKSKPFLDFIVDLHQENLEKKRASLADWRGNMTKFEEVLRKLVLPRWVAFYEVLAEQQQAAVANWADNLGIDREYEANAIWNNLLQSNALEAEENRIQAEAIHEKMVLQQMKLQGALWILQAWLNTMSMRLTLWTLFDTTRCARKTAARKVAAVIQHYVWLWRASAVSFARREKALLQRAQRWACAEADIVDDFVQQGLHTLQGSMSPPARVQHRDMLPLRVKSLSKVSVSHWQRLWYGKFRLAFQQLMINYDRACIEARFKHRLDRARKQRQDPPEVRLGMKTGPGPVWKHGQGPVWA